MAKVKVIMQGNGGSKLRDVKPGQYFRMADKRWRIRDILVMHADGESDYVFSSVDTPRNLWAGSLSAPITDYNVEILPEGTVIEVLV